MLDREKGRDEGEDVRPVLKATSPDVESGIGNGGGGQRKSSDRGLFGRPPKGGGWSRMENRVLDDKKLRNGNDSPLKRILRIGGRIQGKRRSPSKK